MVVVVQPSNLAKLSKGVPLETKQACSIIGEASQNKQERGERVVSACLDHSARLQGCNSGING